MANGYINIANLYKRVPVLTDTNGDHLIAVSDLRTAIAMAAAETGDVVAVVRCMECKHAKMIIDVIGDPHLYCGKPKYPEEELDDFCSYGEKNE